MKSANTSSTLLPSRTSTPAVMPSAGRYGQRGSTTAQRELARRGGLIVTTVGFRAGEEIFAPGGGSTTVYRVASGYVRIYKVLQDGRSINLAMLRPGDYFSQDLH